ncbi:MAG: hypothetical protein WD052_13225 [Bacteroidales bacterium]
MDGKGIKEYCTDLKPYKSLYISKISSNIQVEGESYNARVTLYYLPDTIFFISVVHAGFEIVRVGITEDSTVYINRLEKIAFIYKNSDAGFAAPLIFKDLEFLVNKSKICDYEKVAIVGDSIFRIDRSVRNISREISFGSKDFVLKEFEFFQKKTGEYVVGEFTDKSKFVIYSNYIVDDLKIEAAGGNLEYDRKLDVNLFVNPDKYDIIYF